MIYVKVLKFCFGTVFDSIQNVNNYVKRIEMKKQSYSFPSVYEAVGTNLNFVSKDLINGLQLYDADEQAYILGNLALTEGISPNKLVNSSPHEIDYNLLLKAGLLLANHKDNRPLTVTTGFPFSTYQVYKNSAKDLIMNLDNIHYNPGTFSDQTPTKINANIHQVEILPEMVGNIIGLRVGETQAEGNFFVVSLGYGTCEAVLSTENGIVHRTALSINGMQYAVDLFMRSLATKYYLGLKTEKQLDVSFRNDYIILDRQKVDIIDLRARILERYYKDIISTGLRKSFTDSDFEKADKIYLTGGGALFPELIEQFKEEFKQIADVEVVKNPLTLTSEGYSLNSIMLTGGDEASAIGLDVGNANTVLTQYEDENKQETTVLEEKIEVPTIEDEVVEEKVEVVEEKVEDKVEEIPAIEEKEEIVDEVIEEKVIEEKVSKEEVVEDTSEVVPEIVEEIKEEEKVEDTTDKNEPIVEEETLIEEKKEEVIEEPKVEEVKEEKSPAEILLERIEEKKAEKEEAVNLEEAKSDEIIVVEEPIIEEPKVETKKEAKKTIIETKIETPVVEEIAKEEIIVDKKEEEVKEKASEVSIADDLDEVINKIIQEEPIIVKKEEKEENKEKTYEEKLADLSEEELNILNKEVKTSKKDDSEETDKLESTGSFDDYEPDFS